MEVENFLAAVGADIDLEFVAGKFLLFAHLFGDFKEMPNDCFVTLLHVHYCGNWLDRND